MLRILLTLAAILSLAGCQEPPNPAKTKILIGATLIASPSAPPVEDAIVLVIGDTIRATGLRKDVPVPQDSQRFDLQGKWLVSAGSTPVAEGQPANLLVLDHAPAPGITPTRRMTAGKWDQ